jgi:hypothetical protein
MFMQGLVSAWQQAMTGGTTGMPWSKHSRMTYVDYPDVAEVSGTGFAEDVLDHGTFELAAAGTIDRVGLAALMSEVAGRTITAEDPGELRAGQPAGLKAMFDDYDKHGLHGANALVLQHPAPRAPDPDRLPARGEEYLITFRSRR